MTLSRRRDPYHMRPYAYTLAPKYFNTLPHATTTHPPSHYVKSHLAVIVEVPIWKQVIKQNHFALLGAHR